MPLALNQTTLDEILGRQRNPFQRGTAAFAAPQQLLGGPTGLEQATVSQATGLPGTFDVGQERAARQGFIENQTQQEFGNIGRLFGLDPAGLQQGRAIRAASEIGGARLGALTNLEQELSMRGPAEARANLEAMASILGQREAAGAQARGLQLAEAGQGLQGALGLGGLALQEQGLFGGTPGRETLAAQQLGLQGELGRGQLGLQQELGRGELALAQQGLNLQEAGLFGGAGGRQTLQAQLGTAGLTGEIGGAPTLAGRQVAEQEAAGLTQRSIATEAQSMQKINDALSRAIQQGNVTGVFTDPLTGATQETLQSQLAQAQLTGQIGGQQTLAGQQLGLQGELGRGGLALAQGTAAEQLRQSELARQENIRATKAGESLTGREISTRGAIAGAQIGIEQQRVDLAQAGLDLQTEMQRGQLAMMQDAQTFGQTVTEAELTGVFNQNPEEWAAFRASYGKNQGDAGYNGAFDFNGNGQIDYPDMISLAQQLPAPQQTLAGQQVQANIANASRALGIDEKRLSDTMTMFGQQMAQVDQQWMSAFTGHLMDAEGKLQWIQLPGEPNRVPTSIEREQWQRNVDNYGRIQEKGLNDFTSSLGKDFGSLDEDQQFAVLQSFLDAKFAAVPVGVSRAPIDTRPSVFQTLAGLVGQVGASAALPRP